MELLEECVWPGPGCPDTQLGAPPCRRCPWAREREKRRERLAALPLGTGAPGAPGAARAKVQRLE